MTDIDVTNAVFDVIRALIRVAFNFKSQSGPYNSILLYTDSSYIYSFFMYSVDFVVILGDCIINRTISLSVSLLYKSLRVHLFNMMLLHKRKRYL